MIHALKPAFVKAASTAPMLLATSHYQNRVFSYPPRKMGPFQPRREFCVLAVMAVSTLGILGVQKDDPALIKFGSFLLVCGVIGDCGNL